MATRMQQRRGTAAQWLSTNNGNGPVLNIGEIGYESDTNKFKIGDGVSHWIDLNYFADSVELGGSIDDYIPLTQKGAANGVATLNSSGVIPSEQIPSLVGLDSEITTAVNNAVTSLVGSAPDALNTLQELAAAIDNDNTFSSTIVTALGTKQEKVTGVTSTEIGYLDGVTSAIQTQIDSKVASDDLINTTQDAIIASAGLTKTYDSNADTITIALDSTIPTKTEVADDISDHNQETELVHGIADTSELATKTFAANLLVNATKTNIQITGDKDGITIVAENGVADSTTDNLSEGTINKYFTDERAQDAIGNSIGSGLSYDDTTGAISVDETFVDSNISAALVAPTISTSLTLDGSGDFTIAADANIVLDATTEVYVGSAASGNEVATKSYVDSGLGNKLDSTTAASTYAPIASPTFTGTSTTDDLVVNGDFTVNGTNFSASATSITIEDNLVQLAHQNAANTVDLGLVVAYNDGAAKHAGIVRDVSDSKWKLFVGVSDEPSTTVNFGQGSLDNLAINNLDAVDIVLTGDISAVDATFTGTVTGVTKSHVGLGNVDNTADADKPVSTATQTALDAKLDSVTTINAQTANYTLVLGDKDKMVEMNVGSANTLTVPANSSVAYPVGTKINIVQTGSGQTTLTAGGGVTINGTPGLKTRAQWSAVTLVKRATDTWVAFGDLTA